MGNRKLLNVELGRMSAEDYGSKQESGLVVVADNIRSAHNIGSLFRTCDCFGVDRVYLCGISAVPPSAEIHKSALGAESSVPWEHFDDTMDVVAYLKESGYKVVSVEQTVDSVMLDRCSVAEGRFALVFGNEVEGVRQDVVDASDFSVEIPQFGSKHSLNVSVAAGVTIWHFCRLRYHGSTSEYR